MSSRSRARSKSLLPVSNEFRLGVGALQRLHLIEHPVHHHPGDRHVEPDRQGPPSDRLVLVEALDPSTPISELMTPDPVAVAGDERLSRAIQVMTQSGYRHLPLVTRGGSCEGLLAMRDVLRFIAAHFPQAVLNLPPRLHQQIRRAEGG